MDLDLETQRELFKAAFFPLQVSSPHVARGLKAGSLLERYGQREAGLDNVTKARMPASEASGTD